MTSQIKAPVTLFQRHSEEQQEGFLVIGKSNLLLLSKVSLNKSYRSTNVESHNSSCGLLPKSSEMQDIKKIRYIHA
jgi:hypothetical protein